jgi:glyoxylase-like metal-dependent hydrolase (beta-lactamase superfamily II)
VVIGQVEVLPLLDAVGELAELSEVYPSAPAEAWDPWRRIYPELFAGDRWRLPCTCYLIRSAGSTVLVDTGVGPAGLWDWEAESEEGLLPALADNGVSPDEVGLIFLTHLHIDHIGWNADRDGKPVFPRARFLAHPEAVAFARKSDRPHIERCVLSLLERGVVDPVEDGAELAESVSAAELPGHYPGHLGLRIESDGERALLIADAAVHPILLDQPEERYISDWDAATSAATRMALISELVDADTVVVCGHYPGGGVGRVVRRGGRVVWEAA